MLDRIVSALQAHPDVHDWTVTRRVKRGVQLYLIDREIEALRHVVTEQYDLDVINDHPVPAGVKLREVASPAPSGLARGIASMKLVPGDAGRLERQIDEAVGMARLVHNPWFALAGPAAYPDVALADPLLSTADGASREAARFTETVAALVSQERDVRLSAAELFLTHSDVELRNSRGVSVATTSTHIMSEIALLAKDAAGEEAEHFRQVEARTVADLRLEGVVRTAATYARDTLRATPPRTGMGAIVLGEEALVPLFDAFLFHAGASAAFSKLTTLDFGQSIFADQELRGDPLVLIVDAVRPYGLSSYRFDGDGLPGQTALLFDRGILRARHSGQRYARYLGIPPTGAPGNTVVAAGSRSLEALLRESGPIYYVVGFSSEDVDPVTGNFGSEIRLGYEVTASGEWKPIKGGSCSGNVFEAFAAARLSSDLLEQKGYYGPRAARFESLRVAGEDAG